MWKDSFPVWKLPERMKKSSLSQAKAQLEMLQKERSEKQEIATNIRVELRHNQEFVALEEEKKGAEKASG